MESSKPDFKDVKIEPETLTYGTKITISLSENSNFYITSDGFVLGEVHLRNMFEVKEPKPDPRDASDCVFQILPFSTLSCFKTQSFLAQKTRSLEIFDMPNPNQYEERKCLLEDMKNKLWDEIVSIQSIFDKTKGQPVYYEVSCFLLLHMNSMRLLSAAENSEQNKFLRLVDFPNENSFFKFLPNQLTSNMQKILVHSGDPLRICQFNCNTLKKKCLKASLRKAFKRKPLPNPNPPKIFVTVEEPTEWNVNFFGSNQGQESSLKNFDVIYLSLSELTSNIVIVDEVRKRRASGHLANGSLKSISEIDSPGIFQQRSRGLSYSKITDDPCNLPKSTPKAVFSQGFNSSKARKMVSAVDIGSLWKVEATNPFLGSEIKWFEPLRLKHLTSGLYLRASFKKDTKSFILKVSHKEDQGSLFSFIPLKGRSRTGSGVLTRDFYYLFSIKAKMYIRYPEEIGMHFFQAQIPQLRPFSKPIDTFKIKRAHADQVYEARFLLAVLPIVEKISNFFQKAPSLEEGNPDLGPLEEVCLQGKICFEKLEDFVMNRLPSSISNNQDFHSLCPSRQNIMRQLHIFPHVINIISWAFPEVAIESSHLVLEEKATDYAERRQKRLRMRANSLKVSLCETVYRFIGTVSVNNMKNQQVFQGSFNVMHEHLARKDFVLPTILKIFTKHGKTSKIYRLRVRSNSLSDEIENKLAEFTNEKIPSFYVKRQMESFTDKEGFVNLLDKLIYSMLIIGEEGSAQILRFLREICEMRDGMVFRNQTKVLKRIFSPHVKAVLLSMSLSADGKFMQVNPKANSPPIELSKFFSIHVDIDSSGFEKPQVLCETQLNLFAALVSHRNEKSRMKLKKLFPMKLLINYTIKRIHKTEALPINIRATFVKLLARIYIDQKPRTPITKPNFIRVVRLREDTKDRIREPRRIEELGSGNVESDSSEDKKIFGLGKKLLKIVKHISKHAQKQMRLDYFSEAKTRKIFNDYTVEVLRLLLMVLKFGLLSKKGMNEKLVLTKKQNQKHQDQEKSLIKLVEDLVKHLVLILEFDPQYWAALRAGNIRFKHELINNGPKIYSQVQRVTSLVKGESGGYLTTLTLKVEKNKEKDVSRGQIVSEMEKGGHSFVQKSIRMRNIFKKFGGKFAEPIKEEDDWLKAKQKKVKLIICEIFSFILDIRSDFQIKEVFNFYEDEFKDYIYKESDARNRKNKTKIQYEMFERLMPKFRPKPMDTRPEPHNIRFFDHIIGRPFIQPLLLSFYFSNSPELQSSILDLIKKHTQQTSQLLKNLKKVELLVSVEQISFFKLVQSQNSLIKTLVSEAQLSLQTIYASNTGTVYEKQLRQMLVEIRKVLKIFRDCKRPKAKSKLENSLSLSLDESMTIGEGDFGNDESQAELQIGKEKYNQDLAKISKLKRDEEEIDPQSINRIFRHIEGEKTLISFLKDSMSIQKEMNMIFKGEQGVEKKFKIYIFECICEIQQAIFEVLGEFAEGSHENQELLLNHIDLFMSNSVINFGQSKLIAKIFKGNLALCSRVPKKVLKFYIKLIQVHGKCPELLEIFEVLCECNAGTNVNIEEIKKKVLKVFISEDYSAILSPFDSKEPQENKISPDKLSFAFEKTLDQVKYKEAFFRVFSIAIDQSTTSEILHRTFNFLKIKEIFESLILAYTKGEILPNHFFGTPNAPLLSAPSKSKDSLLYLSRFYGSFSSEKNSSDLQQESPEHNISSSELGIKPYLIRLLDVFLQKLSGLVTNALLSHTRHLGYIFEYETSALESPLCLNSPSYCTFLLVDLGNFACTYTEKAGNNLLDAINTQEVRSVLGKVRKFIKKLDSKFDFIMLGREAPSYQERNVLNRISIVFAAESLRIEEEINRSPFNKGVTPKSKSFLISGNSSFFNDSFASGSQVNQANDTFLSQMAKDLSVKKESLKGNMPPRAVWDRMVQCIETNLEIRKCLHFEKIFVPEFILSFEENFILSKKSPFDLVVNSVNNIDKILMYISCWEERQAPKSTVNFLLQVLYHLVKKYSNNTKQSDSFQKIMDSLGAVETCIRLFWEETSKDSFYMLRLVKLITLLLENGGKKSQISVMNLFLQQQGSEKLFRKIHKAFVREKKTMNSLWAAHGHKSEKKLIKLLLRMIQLLCENHNQEMQEYFHTQTNSKVQYNIISSMIYLASSYLIGPGNYPIVMQLFDTLIEVTQGPCRLNQIEVCKSKLLEYVASILTMDPCVIEHFGHVKRTRTELKRKMTTKFSQSRSNLFGEEKREWKEPEKGGDKMKIEKYQMQRLKEKCLLLLQALMEDLEPGGEVMFLLVRAIPLNALRNILIEVHESYKKVYKDKKPDLNLYYRGSAEIDPKHPSDYYELIFENGLNSFILMKQVLDLFAKNEKNALIPKKTFRSKGFFKSLKALNHGFFKKWFKKCKRKGKKVAPNENVNLSVNEKFLKRQKYQKKVENASSFFEKNILHIDFVRFGRLHRLYFPVLPFCHNLRNLHKKKFHIQVDRSSTQAKLSFLLKEAPKLITIMKNEFIIQKKAENFPIIGFFYSQVYLMENLRFAVVVFMNLVILLYYEDNQFTKTLANGILLFTGLITTVLTIFIFLFHLRRRIPVILSEIRQSHMPASKSQTLRPKKAIKNWIRNRLKEILGLLQTPDLEFQVAMLLFGFLAMGLHPFFWSFHLSEIFRVDIVKTVVSAVWIRKIEIALTFLIFFLLEYYFTLIAYAIFFEHYPEMECNLLVNCYLTTIDQTFKNGGGIGGYLEDPFKEEDKINMKRFFFDHIFNISLVLVLLNMVAGIIIDEFGALKEKLMVAEEDMKSCCFICGFNREWIEKHSGIKNGFETHVTREHSVWSYLFFLAYLKCKEKKNFNGTELYIWRCIQNYDISWFPVGKAFGFDPVQEESEKKKNFLMKAIQNNSEIVENLRRIEETLKRIETIEEEFKYELK